MLLHASSSTPRGAPRPLSDCPQCSSAPPWPLPVPMHRPPSRCPPLPVPMPLSGHPHSSTPTLTGHLAHPHPPWPTELLCAPWPPVSQIKTCMPVEEHASSVLTPHAFEVFQKELVSSTQFAVYETQRDAYLVRHHLKTDGGHLVSCIPANEEIHCSCKEFEFSGMMCRHSLRVLALKNCFMLPEKYLLIRWRRESSLFPKSSGYKYRSQALRSLASIIIQESSLTKDRFDYVKWHMSKLLTHVRDMPTVDEGASDLEPVSSLDATMDVAPVRSRGNTRFIGNTSIVIVLITWEAMFCSILPFPTVAISHPSKAVPSSPASCICRTSSAPPKYFPSAKTLGSLPPPCPAPSISFSSSLKEREGAVDTGSGGGGAEGAGVLEALH